MLMVVKNKTSKFLEISSQASDIWKGFLVMASESKTPRVMKRIGTHDGVFHCDEALACFMLKQLPEYRDAEIVRSRNSSILDTCDIVIDVGGVYNRKTHRYDHHQREFTETLSTVRPDLAKDKHIKLSSAGLIYAHFGIEILTEILTQNNISPTNECLNVLFNGVYEGFVEEVDAIDNGIPMYTEGHPRYKIGTHLSARVHRINPEWNVLKPEPQDKLFEKAVELVGMEFTDKVLEMGRIWWPAREIVKNAIVQRFETYSTGQIIELKDRCPWKDHLLSLEEEMGISGQIKFCIFHDKGDSWRVQAIPLQPDSFICRVFLHSDWRGLRDEEISEVSGVEDAIFCHSTGFIGGSKSREGAIKMAIKSLKAATTNGD